MGQGMTAAALVTLAALVVTPSSQVANRPPAPSRAPTLITLVRVSPVSIVNRRQARITVRVQVGAVCWAQVVDARHHPDTSKALQLPERAGGGIAEWRWNLQARMPGPALATVRCHLRRVTQRASARFWVVTEPGPYRGITILVERFYRDPHPDLYGRPPAGFSVYVARVQITNAGADSYPYLESDFLLRGPDLTTYQPLMGYFHLTLGAGIVRPGDVAVGNLVYTARPGQQLQFLWMAPHHAPILVLPLPQVG